MSLIGKLYDIQKEMLELVGIMNICGRISVEMHIRELLDIVNTFVSSDRRFRCW